jgi:hypothetical protein
MAHAMERGSREEMLCNRERTNSCMCADGRMHIHAQWSCRQNARRAALIVCLSLPYAER